MLRNVTKSYPEFRVQKSVVVNSSDEKLFLETGTNVYETHPRFREYPHFRSGGSWTASETSWKGSRATGIRNVSPGGSVWEGTVCPNHFGTSPNPTERSQAYMESRGATALSRVIPTAPQQDMLVDLAELYREGLPHLVGHSLWKEKINLAKGAGGDYLNVEFGWKPLVSAIKGTALTAIQQHKTISRYLKDSEKLIKRRYDYPSVQTTTVIPGYGVGYPNSAGLGWTGATTVTKIDSEWAEFAFMYHVPTGTGTMDQLRRWRSKADHLYGVSMTPEVAWNLTPWSWAIDWFTNVGDVMKNVSAMGRDGLQVLYGYHMHSSVVTRRTNAYTVLANGTTVSGMLLTTQKTLRRVPANPYGFGATGLATTTRQKAIAAAIAATRSSSLR